MKRSSKTTVVLLVLVALVAFAMPVFSSGQGEEEAYVAIVSKGFQHDFWQQVKIGSEEAAEEYGVDMTFEGPPSESDVQEQVQMLNNALAKNPQAIALAALDTEAVRDQLVQARDSDIPVVGFDSGVPDAPEGSIVANASTDNYAAAGLAAEKMFAEIQEDIENADASNPVKIAVMNQDSSGESLLSRGRGFRDRMVELIVEEAGRSEDDIRVMGNSAYIADDSPTDGDAIMIEMEVPASAAAQDATASADSLLDKVEEDNIVGIFCSNEATVKGLLAATDDGSALGGEYSDLVIVGYDAGESQKNAVREGYFLGSITQDPRQIGYKAVELAYKAYQGESVSDVDTGAKFYDASNMDDDDIAPLLYD